MNESDDAKALLFFGGYHPAAWEQIPDLGLYSDQVITYLERQYKGLYREGERIFTPAMVNNYVKMGLVDRPIGKKYGREQLAQLLMICLLKQATTADGLRLLLKPREGETLPELYAHFCQTQEAMLNRMNAERPLPSAMDSAICCAAYRFLCTAALGKETESTPPTT